MLSSLCIEEPPITVLCALYCIALPAISFIAILSNMFDKPTVWQPYNKIPQSEAGCRVAKHVGQINRSLLHAANSNPRGENAESAPRAASCQILRLLFLLCSSAAGQGCRWYVAAEVAFSALRRAGYWWLRGGAKFRWRVAAEGVFSVLRRAG